MRATVAALGAAIALTTAATAAARTAAPSATPTAVPVTAADDPQMTGPAAGDAGYLVAVGDSTISGEGGRWAGNGGAATAPIDAGGPTTYFDNPARTGELIPKCHRSSSAEVHIGGIPSLNLACSGARTFSSNEGRYFKPGLDFYADGGQVGQLVMLREFARDHRIAGVLVGIGANNFRFGPIVATCVQDFALSTRNNVRTCSTSDAVLARFAGDAPDDRSVEIAEAIRRVRESLTDADPANSDVPIFVQNYSSPLPAADRLRFPEGGLVRVRRGGCGLWDVDVNWANEVMVEELNATVARAIERAGDPHVLALDVSAILDGHRLCETGVGRLAEMGLTSWTDDGAADASEWVTEIRTLTAVIPPHQFEEGLHPNYWGQLALRNCLRQAWNGGSPRPGSCEPTSDLNGNGEPNVAFSAA